MFATHKTSSPRLRQFSDQRVEQTARIRVVTVRFVDDYDLSPKPNNRKNACFCGNTLNNAWSTVPTPNACKSARFDGRNQSPSAKKLLPSLSSQSLLRPVSEEISTAYSSVCQRLALAVSPLDAASLFFGVRVQAVPCVSRATGEKRFEPLVNFVARRSRRQREVNPVATTVAQKSKRAPKRRLRLSRSGRRLDDKDAGLRRDVVKRSPRLVRLAASPKSSSNCCRRTI